MLHFPEYSGLSPLNLGEASVSSSVSPRNETIYEKRKTDIPRLFEEVAIPALRLGKQCLDEIEVKNSNKKTKSPISVKEMKFKNGISKSMKKFNEYLVAASHLQAQGLQLAGQVEELADQLRAKLKEEQPLWVGSMEEKYGPNFLKSLSSSQLFSSFIPKNSSFEEDFNYLTRYTDQYEKLNETLSSFHKEDLDRVENYLQLAEKKRIQPSKIQENDLEIFLQEKEAEEAFKELCLEEKSIADKISKQRNRREKKAERRRLKDESPALVVVQQAEKLNSEPLKQGALKQTQAISRMQLCQKWFEPNKFKLHSRVKRWATDNFNAIRQFTDRGIRKYLNCTPEQIDKFKDYHFVKGTNKLVLNNIYSFPTNTGSGLLCRLKRKQTSHVCGIIYFGIDKDVIYHMCFEELDASKLKKMEIFKAEHLNASCVEDTTCEGLEQQDYKLNGKYNYQVSTEGLITINYANGNILEVYPVRKDLLPKDLFICKDSKSKK